MDPPLINDASFSAANPSSYTLTEIWPFTAINGDTSGGGIGPELRMGILGGGFRDRDGLLEKSTVTEHIGGGGGGGSVSGVKRRDSNLEDESSKMASTTSSGNELNGSSVKRLKTPVFRSGDAKSEAKAESNSATNKKLADQGSKSAEPPKDYIHVRARRGQATDSHSLAERARREKISERMKTLQDLVPGCNKVIGKALVLDEIINYIQSLQRQVEFLSMKIEAVNSQVGLSPMVESFQQKDLEAQPFGVTGMIFGSQPTRDYAQEEEPNWLHMQSGGNFSRPHNQ